MGSHEKGPFQPVHPRLAPFHSKLAISFQTGSIPWMKWESPSGIWSLHKTFGRWSLEGLGKKQHQQGWICFKNPEIWTMMASSNAQNERNWSNWLSQCFQDQLPASLLLTFPAVTLAVQLKIAKLAISTALGLFFE